MTAAEQTVTLMGSRKRHSGAEQVGVSTNVSLNPLDVLEVSHGSVPRSRVHSIACTSTLMSLVISVAGISAASAANEVVAGARDDRLYVVGLRGNQNIRTDPPIPQNADGSFKDITFVHPFQLLLPGDSDFVAIGTYKGAVAGVGNCVADFNSKWSVYTDGVINGIYFCNTQVVNAYSAGEISHH
ncbi:hypothetical protein [Nocardioides sp.]|uniref:hypothetical protein n=1 Tax=Nocardioides sp. TaxID=35761 RepID=UPI0035678BCC